MGREIPRRFAGVPQTMTWHEVHRIRVFGEPIETARPRHRIVLTREFSDWWDNGCPKENFKILNVLKMLFVHTYMPSKADAWKKTIRYHAAGLLKTCQIEGPIRVDLEIIMPRPKFHYGTGRNKGKIKPRHASDLGTWHTPTPDRDNLDKTILDALSPTPTATVKRLKPEQQNDPVYNFPGLWRNDSQVCSGLVEKRYHRQGEELGAIIVVSRWSVETNEFFTDDL